MTKQDLVLVKWNEGRIKTLPVIKRYSFNNSLDKTKEKEIAEKNKTISAVQKQINTFVRSNNISKVKSGTIYLTQGINCIPKKYWEMCKEHKAVQIDLELNRLEEIVEKTITEVEANGKKKKVEKIVTAFSDMTLKKKEKIIQETVDIRTLNSYLNEESSPDIRVVLQNKIKEIQDAKTDGTIDHPKGHLKTS